MITKATVLFYITLLSSTFSTAADIRTSDSQSQFKTCVQQLQQDMKAAHEQAKICIDNVLTENGVNIKDLSFRQIMELIRSASSEVKEQIKDCKENYLPSQAELKQRFDACKALK